jgi:hypothetical protein
MFAPGAHLTGGRNAAAVHKAGAEAFYRDVMPLVARLRSEGLSLRAIAAELQRRSAPARYGDHWSASTVRRVLARADCATTPNGPCEAARMSSPAEQAPGSDAPALSLSEQLASWAAGLPAP